MLFADLEGIFPIKIATAQRRLIESGKLLHCLIQLGKFLPLLYNIFEIRRVNEDNISDRQGFAVIADRMLKRKRSKQRLKPFQSLLPLLL